MGNLYLDLYDKTTKKQFRKYFICEFEMDKFKRKLHYSRKLVIIKDGREDDLSYERW